MITYGDARSVLIIADSERGAARARLAAERASCRVSAAIGIDAAVARLDQQAAPGAVLVDVQADHGTALDRLLDNLESAARSGRHASVISAPPELVDAIAVRTPNGGIIQLCAPSEADWALAATLASTAAETASAVAEAGKGGAPRLQQLSEEVGRIASILASLSEEEAPSPGRTAAGDEAAAGISAREVRAIIRARRLRDQYLSGGFFADPAWDMLLDLMAARLEGERVAVSSLCIAAAVPPTTALRWIKTLVEQGLFVRVADPEDGRRVFIELSDDTAGSLQAYLGAARRIASAMV